MDHLAHRSMKNAANCVKYGELQGSRNRNMSNAYCAFNITMMEARLSEGLFTLKHQGYGGRNNETHITVCFSESERKLAHFCLLPEERYKSGIQSRVPAGAKGT